jgi:acyl dehydratase
MNTEIGSIADVLSLVGHPLGTSAWLVVTQSIVDQFAQATGDTQWIHVDPERASGGPFGGCIAHGHLTLSLAGGKFVHEIVRTSARMGVNYGCDRVRFPAPVVVGSRVRGAATLVAAAELPGGGVQVAIRMTVEIQGSDKPACVADLLARFYF